jgi:hypothetical protein
MTLIWLLLAASLATALFMDFRVLRAIYRWVFAGSAATD